MTNPESQRPIMTHRGKVEYKAPNHYQVSKKSQKSQSIVLAQPLVAVDGQELKTKEKSMRQKMLCGEISSVEYCNYCARVAGFKNNNDRRQHWRHKTGKNRPQKLKLKNV